MKNWFKKRWLAAALIATISLNLGLSFADEGDFEVTEEQSQFLNQLKTDLKLSKTDYKQLLKHINDTKTKLSHVTEERMTLDEQLGNIDSMVEQTNEKVLNAMKLMIEKENQVKLINEEIEIKQIALSHQKEVLKDYLRLLYQEENEYLSMNADGSVDAFKLLLDDNSVGDNLRHLQYFDVLNESGLQMVDKLDDLADQLEFQRDQLEVHKAKLAVIETKLQEEKEQLDIQKESKEKLLKLTSGQEKIYEKLLEQTIEQQQEVVSDLKSLSDAVTFVEAKIAEEGVNFDPEEYDFLLDYRNKAVYDFSIGVFESISDSGFIWPVEPTRGISAFFRESAYKATFGVRHNAIDLPVNQGSPVRSAAAGVIYSAADNGYGYSYIVVAHSEGFSTVYGHMSEILVEEGDQVNQGEVIGLSGGMPGTKGAGYMTTGPHLHFEMLLNGIHVDPMYHMDLEVFDEDEIDGWPEKYQFVWEQNLVKAAEELILR